MANKYAVASGAWSAIATWSDTDGGAGGAAVPADGDAVFISAGVSVLMDVDLSAYTGLFGVTVRGDATTPGMLYWKNGTSGYLKIRTGYSLVGTTGTLKGRVLVNSDGVWGNTGSLAFADKAVIDLGATSRIYATYLDLAFYGYNAMPNKYVRTYGVRHTVTADAGTDTLNKTAHGLTNTTPVMIMSSGAIPAPLEADTLYYVVSTAANTFQLAYYSGGAAIDLTNVGSGTIEVYTGAANGASPVNVFEDVTAETGWTTDTGHNRAVFVDHGPQSYDQQRVTITAIAAGTITLSSALTSIASPGARIGLSSRNVSIQSATLTNIAVVDYNSATADAGVFQCELVSTAGTGTTFYGFGIQGGTGHTVSGTMMGFNYAVTGGTGHTISGIIMGCNSALQSGEGHTMSGTVMGCVYAFNSGSGHNMSGTTIGCSNAQYYGSGNTISGTVIGCNYGFFVGVGHTMSGTLRGCAWPCWYGAGFTISGTVTGSGTAIASSYGFTISGTIVGCSVGLGTTQGHTVSGAIIRCGTAINSGSYGIIVTGRIGYDLNGVVAPNTTDFTFGNSGSANTLNVVCRGAWLPTDIVFSRNSTSSGGISKQGVWCEDYGAGGAPVLGASKSFQSTGDVIKNTVTLRTGGAASSLEVVPLSSCSVFAPVLVCEWTELGVPASAQNKSVYVRGEGWTVWPTASELYLEAEYVSNATTFARTTVTSTQVLTDNITWVQLTTGSFTPANAAHVRYRVWLKKYEAASKVYVDNALYG